MHADHPTSGPLAGIKVVDLTRGIPGAIATMLLADYGADVLKLQNPSGDVSTPASMAELPACREGLMGHWAVQGR